VGVAIIAICGLLLLAFFLSRRRRQQQGADVEMRNANLSSSSSRSFALQTVPPKPEISPTTATSPKMLTRTESQYKQEITNRDNWEIDYTQIIMGRELGRGAFGTVHYATWRNAECAVKQLLLNAKNEETLQMFLKEANNMKKIRPHAKVVAMFGVCTNPEYPLCIVTEFLIDGNLYDYLHNASNEINGDVVVAMATDVASGMSHLHEEGIIHCDLACRNLLIIVGKSTIFVKVADFGLSKMAESGIYDASSDKKFPVKWSSPEVLNSGKLSRASDVWSYGVVLYEMLERRIPYAGMSNQEVIKFVCDQDKRLAKPTKIPYPPLLYSIMQDCFKKDPKSRPTFPVIYSQLMTLSRADRNAAAKGKQKADNVDYVNLSRNNDEALYN